MDDIYTTIEHSVKKFGKDTLTYIPAKLIPGIGTILSVAIFTRIFSPAEYGKYILVFTTTTILIIILSQWVTQSILRYRAEYVRDQRIAVFNHNSFKILSILSIIILAFGAIFHVFGASLGEYQRFYVVAVLIVATGIWFECLSAIFQSDLRAGLFTLYAIVNAILKFVLVIVLVILVSKDVIHLLWAVFMAYLFPVLLMIAALRRSTHRQDLSRDASSTSSRDEFYPFLRQFFVYGFPMIGWFLGTQLLSVSDRYFLQIFRNSEEVGIYSSNYNLVASAIVFVSMPLLTAAHPLLMKLGTSLATKKHEVQTLITLFSRYFMIIACPVVAYVLVFSVDLADVFLGVEYRQGNIVMPVVLCGLVAWYSAMFGHKGFEFREKTNIMFMLVLMCSAVKVLLNLLFIPRYGYMAAAVSTLVCFLLYPVLVYFGTREDIKWVIPWLSLAKISFASIVLGLLYMLVRHVRMNTILTLTIGGLLTIPFYLGMLYLLGEIKDYETNYIRLFIRKNMLRARIGV